MIVTLNANPSMRHPQPIEIKSPRRMRAQRDRCGACAVFDIMAEDRVASVIYES